MMPEKDSSAYLREECAKIKDSFFGTLIDRGEYGFALIAADFTVLEANQKFLEWFPETRAAGGAHCYRCLYARKSFCPGCPAALSLQDGKIHAAVIEHDAGGACAHYFTIICAPIIDSRGCIQGIMELAESEPAVPETSLHQELYPRLLDSLNDAIISCDGDGTIVLFNKKAQELFGYSEQDIIGKKFSALVPPETVEQQLLQFQRLQAKEHPWMTEKIMFNGLCLKSDGTTFPAEASYSTQKTGQGVIITAIFRDISERRASEEKLQQYAQQLEQEVTNRTRDLNYSQERLHLFLETASDAIVSTDRDGTIIYVNKTAEEIFDYQREEILGKNIALLTPREIWQVAQTSIHIQDGRVTNPIGKTLESWGIKKDRTTFPIEFSLSVFERDIETYFTSIIRDISRRKKLEQKLQEYTTTLEERVKERTFELTQSQQRLNEKIAELSILNEIGEALSSTMELELVLDIILVGATSHQGLGFNRAFLFLINQDGSLLEGKVAVGPAHAEEAHRVWSEILGKQMTLREMLYSYTRQQGNVDSYVNELVRQIKIPLQSSENILTHVVKTCKPFNIVDASAHPLVPRELTDLLRCNAFAVVPLIAREKVLGVLWADNAITQKPIEERDVERLRIFSNNASLALENSNLYQNIQDKVAELNRAYHELQENKDRLVRTEKLAAVGEMSAMVAHAIRNPLTAIGGFARRLFKKEAGNSAINRYLKIIIDEIDRLEVLLNEILDFVRPREPNRRPANINELLEGTLEILDEEFAARTICVIKEYAPDLPQVTVDGDQFREVFLNILRNAMDAMPNGGTITVSSGVEDAWIKITFADTGMGISESDAEKIFHPFFTRKAQGSGLGLAMSNQIIAFHNGHITLRRAASDGATFDIFLPLE
jgi:PAS domain S-box-containing protein